MSLFFFNPVNDFNMTDNVLQVQPLWSPYSLTLFHSLWPFYSLNRRHLSLSCVLVLALLSPWNSFPGTFCILPNYSYLTQKDPPWSSPQICNFHPLLNILYSISLLNWLHGSCYYLEQRYFLFVIYGLSSTLECKHHKCDNLNELMSVVILAPCTVIATFSSFKFLKFPFGKK